jgi:hypothetical protein
MSEVKTFVFRYEEVPPSEEEETDFGGTIAIPKVHDLLYRKGKAWMVTKVVPEYGKVIPVVQVFLAENSSRGPRTN